MNKMHDTDLLLRSTRQARLVQCSPIFLPGPCLLDQLYRRLWGILQHWALTLTFSNIIFTCVQWNFTSNHHVVYKTKTKQKNKARAIPTSVIISLGCTCTRVFHTCSLKSKIQRGTKKKKNQFFQVSVLCFIHQDVQSLDWCVQFLVLLRTFQKILFAQSLRLKGFPKHTSQPAHLPHCSLYSMAWEETVPFTVTHCSGLRFGQAGEMCWSPSLKTVSNNVIPQVFILVSHSPHHKQGGKDG